ncbi:hypothetical protein MMC25_002490 [Agyrium rufum]|nr:hypothetical protein [Agyrium rufum]
MARRKITSAAETVLHKVKYYPVTVLGGSAVDYVATEFPKQSEASAHLDVSGSPVEQDSVSETFSTGRNHRLRGLLDTIARTGNNITNDSGVPSAPTNFPPSIDHGTIPEPKLTHLTGNGDTPPFDPLFLRDACSCSRCVNESTKQKNFETAQIPLDIRIRTWTILEDVDQIRIAWENDIPDWDRSHRSVYSISWLQGQRNVRARMGVSHNVHQRTLWDKEIMSRIRPVYDAREYIYSDVYLKSALEALERYGVIFLENAGQDPSMVIKIANRIGPMRQTLYGSTWDVKSVSSAKNVAYTSTHLGLHMDLLYMADPPGLQVLHCINAGSVGGESLFSDSFYAWERLQMHDPDLADEFAAFPVTYQYKNDGHWYQHTHPTIQFGKNWGPGVFATSSGDESGRLSMYEAINWSPPFQAPFQRYVGGRGENEATATVLSLRKYVQGAKIFKSLIEEDRALYRETLKPGEAVIFNNRRVLHGRTAFEVEKGKERWLRGAYVDTDPWRSKLRALKTSAKQNPKEKTTGQGQQVTRNVQRNVEVGEGRRGPHFRKYTVR